MNSVQEKRTALLWFVTVNLFFGCGKLKKWSRQGIHEVHLFFCFSLSHTITRTNKLTWVRRVTTKAIINNWVFEPGLVCKVMTKTYWLKYLHWIAEYFNASILIIIERICCDYRQSSIQTQERRFSCPSGCQVRSQVEEALGVVGSRGLMCGPMWRNYTPINCHNSMGLLRLSRKGHTQLDAD